MGDISDMMLDGTLCATCGAAMDDVADDDFDAPGFPRYCCKACEPEPEQRRMNLSRNTLSVDKTNCPTCGARVKKTGLADHMRAKHGVVP
jgi:hypothetical protein